jgi:hypothetical protein
VVGGEGAVGFGVLFVEDLDGGEVGGEAGAVELVGLLLLIALGDEDEAVAGGEVGQGGGDVGEELDLLVGDGLGEAGDALVLGGGDGGVGELLEAGDERLAEAVEAVAVGADGGVFDLVEMAAHLFGGVDAVVEVGDEAGDGALEVDVVFPEGVVGVDEQGLGHRGAEGLGAEGLGAGGHELIIGPAGGGLKTRGGMTQLWDVLVLLRYARFRGYERDSVDRKRAGLVNGRICNDSSFKAA